MKGHAGRLVYSWRNSWDEATMEDRGIQEGGGTVPGMSKRLGKTGISETAGSGMRLPEARFRADENPL